MEKQKDTGRLIKSFNKRKSWIKFDLPNGQIIKLLMKDHETNKNLFTMVCDCPKDIKISTVFNENIGNQ